MKASIHEKLQGIQERHQELAALLAEPDVINNQDQFRKYSQEYSKLEPVAKRFSEYKKVLQEHEAAQQLLEESDVELRTLVHDEIEQTLKQIDELELELQKLLIPEDPHDHSNVFLEIRAGTGGDEAAIFAGDLFRMYCRFAEHQNWTIEIMSHNEGEHGGYKEVIARVVGRGVYSMLKFESGVHRVQRVPETESQGRIHTSAATVAVMPEAEEIDEVEVNTTDLRIDTFRASGAGGQHVNKTDSAVRLTHLPTGIVVECQDQRSQHKNKARAMSLLQAKLLERERSQQAAEQAQTRRNLVGSGDRSERIRTYNFPQGRVTDHRINLTLYKLDKIMQGDLAPVIDPLNNEHQADMLGEMSGI